MSTATRRPSNGAAAAGGGGAGGVAGPGTGGAGAGGGAAGAAAHARQKAALDERQRQLAALNGLALAGKVEELTAALRKVAALERELFGERDDQTLGTLEALARLHEIKRDWGEARKTRKEVLALRRKAAGEKDWRTVDAWLALKQVDILEGLSPEKSKMLARAAALNTQVGALYRQGKVAQGLPLAQEVLRLRREVLGRGTTTTRPASTAWPAWPGRRGITLEPAPYLSRP